MNQSIRRIIMPTMIVALMLSSTIVANARFYSIKEEQIIIPKEGNLDMKQSQQIYSQPLAPKKYAVIIVGRYFGLIEHIPKIQQFYTWYLTDAAKMYITLRDTYEYPKDNIYLLVKLLPGNYEIPEIFDPDWIDYESNEQNLENVLEKFNPGGEKELNDDDTLYFCFIDHGGNDNVANPEYNEDWPSPVIHSNNLWKNENFAYDNNVNTKAIFSPSILRCSDYWSEYLTLELDSPIKIKGFRMIVSNNSKHDLMQVKFYNGDDPDPLKTVIYDRWPDEKWKYQEFEGEEIEVDKVKIRFRRVSLLGFLTHPAIVKEFDFFDVEGDGEVGRTYFGCPLDSLPEFLWTIFGKDVERLYDYELADYVGDYNNGGIKATVIYALQPCNSGGFINELSGEKRIVCTAARGFEFANEWIWPFNKALRKLDTDGDGKIDGDLYPEDGNMSILEAYRYAADFVALKYPGEFHPLIDDNADNVGHAFYETNYYDYETEGKEGYNAASAFL